MINNLSPGFLPNGMVDETSILAGAKVPPSTLPTIGDALTAKGISWAYYGGGYDAAVRVANGSTDAVDQLVGGNYCDICNPFSYAKSIMGDATQRGEHIKDAIDFFDALEKGQLPAVAYVKPDSLVDGHPASSKLALFEAMLENIVDRLNTTPAPPGASRRWLIRWGSSARRSLPDGMTRGRYGCRAPPRRAAPAAVPPSTRPS